MDYLENLSHKWIGEKITFGMMQGPLTHMQRNHLPFVNYMLMLQLVVMMRVKDQMGANAMNGDQKILHILMTKLVVVIVVATLKDFFVMHVKRDILDCLLVSLNAMVNFFMYFSKHII